MAKGAEEIASFADPLNKVLESRELKNGIKISRVAVPIGSVFFIFESRPNVTIDGACLCFKAGNAVILRGGKESLNSAKCLAGIFHEALAEEGIDQDAVQLVTETSHDLVGMLLQRNDCLDLVIPRGGERLIRAVACHGYGICVDIKPEHEMEKVLFACDELTGLIGACALVRPSKSIQDMELKSLKKKFKDKRFAAGCSRDVIKQGAELLGWSLDDLMTRTMEAMKPDEAAINEQCAAFEK